MLTGLNHLTLAVSDVSRSLAFYRDVLQLRVEASWDAGAYLSLPGLWLCLSLDPLRSSRTVRRLHPLRFQPQCSRFLRYSLQG